jgi:hypothetical protein
VFFVRELPIPDNQPPLSIIIPGELGLIEKETMNLLIQN